MNIEPAVAELVPAPDAEDVFRRLASYDRCLFLDSALRDETLGRYSFVTANPCAWLEQSAAETGGLDNVVRWLDRCAGTRVTGLPPFQGGVAGLFGYDFNRQFETLPAARYDEFGVPALAVGLYDVVVAFDHRDERCWIISQGWPETDGDRRRRRAEDRLAWIRAIVAGACPGGLPSGEPPALTVPASALAPQFATSVQAALTSDFAPDGYLRAVERAVQYIFDGDVFQVNLKQRLLRPAASDSVSLYLRMRRRNPATFAAYLDLGDVQIVSASPERFLRVDDREVESRPIKGTRRRTHLPEADLFAGDELKASEKDRAENVMIVDLMRNDLSRVCETDSVRVTDLCRLENYAFVQHLVSGVVGRLAADKSSFDLLAATFPGGSVTGAPKIRAQEIIAELEPTARGAYCGSLGYIGLDGAMDTSILIRTVTAAGGWWQAPVGGGIVAQSVPRHEYEETWHKAEGLLRAFE
ncbi:MAG: anthranilate synthase component I family protein [Pirellulales bacterium]